MIKICAVLLKHSYSFHFLDVKTSLFKKGEGACGPSPTGDTRKTFWYLVSINLLKNDVQEISVLAKILCGLSVFPKFFCGFSVPGLPTVRGFWPIFERFFGFWRKILLFFGSNILFAVIFKF